MSGGFQIRKVRGLLRPTACPYCKLRLPISDLENHSPAGRAHAALTSQSKKEDRSNISNKSHSESCLQGSWTATNQLHLRVCESTFSIAF